MVERYTSPKIPFSRILRWQLSKYLSSKTAHENNMHIHSLQKLPEGEYALWIGHATLWLHLGETTVAIDPVLGDIMMHPRQTPLPLPRQELRADIILITHAHYDHFDLPSLDFLLQQNPSAIVVAPTGFWRYLKRKIPRERCFELEWWESLMAGGLFITLTPAKHWSKRTLWDTNKALWGGYVIQNQERTIYHSGDSAYEDHFREIGERFEIDEAFLPIGAYRPEWIMSHNHLNPPEAIQAASDVGAKTLIPIHYGTFILSDEPLQEPIEWFEFLTGQKNYPFSPRILKIGEVYRFNETSTLTST